MRTVPKLKIIQVSNFLYCNYEPSQELTEVRLAHLFIVIGHFGHSLSLMCLADGALSVKDFSHFESCFWWYFQKPAIAQIKTVFSGTLTGILR